MKKTTIGRNSDNDIVAKDRAKSKSKNNRKKIGLCAVIAVIIDGTSFAAPNALGNIARVIDKYGITAKEALQAVKKVTKEDAKKNGGAGRLDVVALDKEAKRIVKDRILSTAKEYVKAVANGDVYTIKRLCTPEFYEENISYYSTYSDEEVRQILLLPSYSERQRLVDDFTNNSIVDVITSRAGDFVTLVYTNLRTGKEITFQFIDCGNGEWKLCGYIY